MLPKMPRAFENSFLFHLPGAQFRHVVRNAAVEREHQAQRQLGDRDRVLAGAIGHVDAATGRRRHVDRVVAGTGAHDERQRTGLEHRRGRPSCRGRRAHRPASRDRVAQRSRPSARAGRSRRSRRPSGRRSRFCSNLSATRIFTVQITWRSRPSRSFGSNQVDLGGMMAFASDTAIRSATDTGYREKATANLRLMPRDARVRPCRARRRRSRSACRCARRQSSESAPAGRPAAR